jgi:hypothetical protein
LQYKPRQKNLTLKNSDIAFSLQVAASAVKVGIWNRFFQASPKPIWHGMTRRKMGRVEEKTRKTGQAGTAMTSQAQQNGPSCTISRSYNSKISNKKFQFSICSYIL